MANVPDVLYYFVLRRCVVLFFDRREFLSEQKRILVVDDDGRNRKLLQAMLKSLGYDSDVACDGPEALDKLGQGFDLVLLDLMMPGMDGLEVARRVRNRSEHADIPIMMVTV